MAAPKQYSVTKLVTKVHEPEIQRLLAANPLWKRKHARDLIARRKFQEKITKA
jgi:hypothetical protein